MRNSPLAIRHSETVLASSSSMHTKSFCVPGTPLRFFFVFRLPSSHVTFPARLSPLLFFFFSFLLVVSAKNAVPPVTTVLHRVSTEPVAFSLFVFVFFCFYLSVLKLESTQRGY